MFANRQIGGINVDMRIVLATLLLIAVIPTYGSIIVDSNVTVLPTAPPSVAQGALESDTTMYAFTEQTDVTLTSSLFAGVTTAGTWVLGSGSLSGTIPAGTTVTSYLLRFAPVTAMPGQNYRTLTAQISFASGEEVVGIILGSDHLAVTDAMLGAPGTTYPPISYPLAGLESSDGLTLSAGMQTITVDFHATPDNMDMIRILTISETPEPAAFILIGSGLVALGFCRQRFSRAASR
jgi:hypothetical protein